MYELRNHRRERQEQLLYETVSIFHFFFFVYSQNSDTEFPLCFKFTPLSDEKAASTLFQMVHSTRLHLPIVLCVDKISVIRWCTLSFVNFLSLITVKIKKENRMNKKFQMGAKIILKGDVSLFLVCFLLFFFFQVRI